MRKKFLGIFIGLSALMLFGCGDPDVEATKAPDKNAEDVTVIAKETQTETSAEILTTEARTDETTAEVVVPTIEVSTTAEPTTEVSTEITTTVAPTTEAPTEAPTTVIPTEEQKVMTEFVLNTSTMKIHKPSCKSVSKIKAENRQDGTFNYEDLVAQGYSSCGNCHAR